MKFLAVILVLTSESALQIGAIKMEILRNWFSNMDFEDWSYINSSFQSILSAADDEEEKNLWMDWRKICAPDFNFCANESECVGGESCTNHECLPDATVSHYGSLCNIDANCSGSLVCCGSGKCCHSSEKDRYDKLPCEDDSDCCSDNDLRHCCTWGESNSFGTCCTYEQLLVSSRSCSNISLCGLRLECCAATQYSWYSQDYCCTQAEHDLILGGNAETCTVHDDCFSGYCCSSYECCTYAEHLSEGAACNGDHDCFSTQVCCEDGCCYGETSKAKLWLLMIYISTCVVGLLLIVLVIVLSCALVSNMSNQTVGHGQDYALTNLETEQYRPSSAREAWTDEKKLTTTSEELDCPKEITDNKITDKKIIDKKIIDKKMSDKKINKKKNIFKK